MKESPFGFRYTWEDMRPVRPLAGTTMLFQFLGAGMGYYFGPEPNWFDNVWKGGAAATFPGFLVGLVIQYRINAARTSVLGFHTGYGPTVLKEAALHLERAMHTVDLNESAPADLERLYREVLRILD